MDFETVIWDYITRHALASMGITEEIQGDSNEDFGYSHKDYFASVLFGILNGDNDNLIVAKILPQILLSGFIIKKEDLLEMVRRARDKCKMELFVLGIAVDLLNHGERPDIVLLKVKQMLV